MLLILFTKYLWSWVSLDEVLWFCGHLLCTDVFTYTAIYKTEIAQFRNQIQRFLISITFFIVLQWETLSNYKPVEALPLLQYHSYIWSLTHRHASRHVYRSTWCQSATAQTHLTPPQERLLLASLTSVYVILQTLYKVSGRSRHLIWCFPLEIFSCNLVKIRYLCSP